ncbi:transmembrane protein 185A-like protein [Sarcoptes scabiei]|uniref:Transmembrane protein 185A-like protein n=1 Tax=Sarcoptes scabiei TaxID=52283 RepID=A0A132AFV1_SARSC|nr:transmembrane protein 185A-like protein [Sarcoptes scabiei]
MLDDELSEIIPRFQFESFFFLSSINSSKFVVYSSLLAFSILFALKLDQTITISWWLVFVPLWAWKSLAISGALVGILVWLTHPDYRFSESSCTHFKSMLISISLQLLLLMFELLACDKLESDRYFWTLAFIPLIFISLLSVAVSIWALKNERDFELELFCSVNILQFIFIALRLDRFITWSWVVVFVPLWILLCLAIIGVLYAMIFAVILFRTPEVSIEQRKASFYSAVTYTLIVFPLLVFFVLLSSKLDGKEFKNVISGSDASTLNTFNMVHLYPHIPHQISNLNQFTSSQTHSSKSHFLQITTPIPFFGSFHSFDIDYLSVCAPLYCTLTILICMSFSSKGGNLWWFEYGNITYNFNGIIRSQADQNQQQNNERTNLTAVQVANNHLDYDATDSNSTDFFKFNVRKLNKKQTIDLQPDSNTIIIPNLFRLDTPD